jgi:hypothetical protein
MSRFLLTTVLGLAFSVSLAQFGYASFTFVNDSTITSAISSHSKAAFSQVSADGFNLTRDHSTGLEWLDVSMTRNFSISEALELLGTTTIHGFRLATNAEVSRFVTGGDMSSVDLEWSSALSILDIWGHTFESFGCGFDIVATGRHAGAWTSDGRAFLFTESVWSGSGVFVEGNARYFHESMIDGQFGYATCPMGVALVRIIPEPNSLLLFGIGACVLPRLRVRRRRSQ